MQHSKVVTLDKTNSIDLNIYEVDGLHGTLKELSDYFNVDPVKVSDLMLSGLPIQDALIMVPKNKNIGKAFIDDIEQNFELPVKNSSKKRSTSGKKKSKATGKANSGSKATSKGDVGASVLNSEELHYLSDSDNPETPLAVKTSSDYQELDDLLIVTTTTTIVYKRR